jgi:CheY-like chemotaxis protein
LPGPAGWHGVRFPDATHEGSEDTMTATAILEPLTEQDLLLGLHPAPRPNVILVEDDPEMRLFLTEMLQEEGYDVRAASDSLSGLCLQLRQPADVVVTDWKMPDMDGLRLLQALKRCNPELPVVMVTAYPEEELVRRVQEEGAFSCLAKPFRRAQLLAHLQGALLCARLSTAPREGDPGRPPTTGGSLQDV